MEECLRAGHIDAVALAHAANRHGLTLGAGIDPATSALAAPLCPEEALLWCCVCEHLSNGAAGRGTAAARSLGAVAAVDAEAAGQRLDALELLLPPTTTQLLKLAQAHAERPEGALYFSACQLLRLAGSCVDFADGDARSAAAQLCSRLVSLHPASGCASSCLHSCHTTCRWQ